MFSALASTYFIGRNVDKVQQGDIGRSAVAAGQVVGVMQDAAQKSGLVGNAARGTINLGTKLAQYNKGFEYAGKALKFAADNVNPLICASGVLKTAMSDDKVKTGITEAAALTAMFAGEGLTKLNYDKLLNSKVIKSVIEKLSNTKIAKPILEYLSKNNLNGKVGAAIKAIVFIAASMGSYAIGQKYGEQLADRVKANWNIDTPKKIDQKA